MGFAVSARHTAAGIAARQRLVIQDNTESRETLRRRREAAEAKARDAAVIREVARQERISVWMKEAQGGRPSPRRIIQAIARQHGFTVEDIIGPCRKRPLVTARHHAMWEVSREYPSMSLPRLGYHFGDLDHTTVLSARRKWPAKAKKLGIPCLPLKEPT